MSFLRQCDPDKEVVVRIPTITIPQSVFMFHCNAMMKSSKIWSQYLRDLLISDFQYEIDTMYDTEDD